MTDTTITVHGYDFSVTGDGFRVNRDDFDLLAERIAARLQRMKRETVAKLHRGAMMTDEETGEAPSESAVRHLEAIAYRETRHVTRNWVVKDNIYASVYPV